jgi:hypothetical protein
MGPMGAVEEAGPLISLIPDLLAGPKEAIAKAVDLVLDPAFNEALSPSAGLTVTPLMFSSVEQEGRWKDNLWHFNEARDLTNPMMTAAKNKAAAGKRTQLANPADAQIPFFKWRLLRAPTDPGDNLHPSCAREVRRSGCRTDLRL